MTFNALIVVIGLTGVLFLIAAGRNLRRRRVAGGLLQGVTALVLFLIAAGALLIASGLRTYQRLGSEQPAGALTFTRIGDHQFNGVYVYPSGERADFELRGDEWQVDARMLKWRAFADLIGFDSMYRLDRISGRYTNIEDERALPRTVYPLNAPDQVDLWQVVHRMHTWIPWLDATYGSATFLPMAEGAAYDVSVSQSGLLARPHNQAARDAVASWH